MTLSASPRTLWRPSASLAPPTPPARTAAGVGSVMPARSAELRPDVGHPLDRLVVERCGHPGDDRLEAEFTEWRDRRGDELGRTREMRPGAGVLDAVGSEALARGGLCRTDVVADRDREADSELDLGAVATDLRAAFVEGR